MGKRNLFNLLMLTVILTVVLAGCSKSEFSLAVNNNQTAEITAKNAGTDMSGSAGSIIVEEGRKLYIQPSLNKGEINLKFGSFDLDIDAAPEEVTAAVSGENAVLEIRVSGKDPAEYEIEPGTYDIFAQVTGKADGKILISVR